MFFLITENAFRTMRTDGDIDMMICCIAPPLGGMEVSFMMSRLQSQRGDMYE